jgi:hypothetical protein
LKTLLASLKVSPEASGALRRFSSSKSSALAWLMLISVIVSPVSFVMAISLERLAASGAERDDESRDERGYDEFP